MIVHVDQAGYRELSREIEHSCVARDTGRVGAIDCRNAGATNHDRHVRPNDGLSDINDRNVVEYDCRLTLGALGVKQERQAHAR